MITNPHRRKQIDEFFDKNHPVMDEYYELLEQPLSHSKLKLAMERLITQDPLFFDSYLVLADLLLDEGKTKVAWNLVAEAYQKAVSLIADKEGNWPKQMMWGWLENRHLMRVIERYAYQVWEDGNQEEALEIFRRLLRSNPGDNQGARHAILAILLKLGPDWEKKFLVKKGPMAGQALEAGPLMEWFEKNAKKFPTEFDWLFREWKKMDKE